MAYILQLYSLARGHWDTVFPREIERMFYVVLLKSVFSLTFLRVFDLVSKTVNLFRGCFLLLLFFEDQKDRYSHNISASLSFRTLTTKVQLVDS